MSDPVLEQRPEPEEKSTEGSDASTKGQGAEAASAELRPQAADPTSSRKAAPKKWVIVVAVLLVGATGVYFAFVRKSHASREDCRAAVDRLYFEKGWEYDFPHTIYSIDDSVKACMELTKDDVQCVLKSEHPFLCDPARYQIPIEDLESGLWCFERTNNQSEEKSWQGCAFSKQKCNARRHDAESDAFGARLGECRSFPRLYGVYSNSGRGGWFEMFPDESACLLYWRSNGARLRDAEPGCREVSKGGAPGERVAEPKRPTAKWAGDKPKHVWCFQWTGGLYGRCYTDVDECERQRRASRDPHALVSSCDPLKSAAYFSVGGETQVWADPDVCASRADAAWNKGQQASTCDPL